LEESNMARKRGALRRELSHCFASLGLAAAALALAPLSAQAQPSGENVVLESYTLSAGGETLENLGEGAAKSAQVTVGQPAVGAMEGGDVKLEIGLWPTVPVPEPSATVLALAALASVASLTRKRP
jgi:hypothetical protein